jgi:CHAT domain-containing protein/tetratricopeptide (TPR) repeat protein
MVGWWTARRVAAMLLAALLLGIALAGAVRSQGQDELARLRSEVTRLHGQGRYSEAVPAAERAVAFAREKYGEAHTEFAASLAWLGFTYQALGRYGDAEPLLKRSLAIAEHLHGPEHANVGAALSFLAGLYQAQGRYGDAEPLYKRDLAITEKAFGPQHQHVASAVNNLATLYQAQARYSEAETLFKRVVTIRMKALGTEHPHIAASLNDLGRLYRDQGRYAEAEQFQKQSLAIYEKVFGPDHPHFGAAISNLAGLYDTQGRYSEAEPLYKRDLAITEKALGPEHPRVGISMSNLARTYLKGGRAREAEVLFKRSLAIAEKAFGPDHPDVGTQLNNLAELFRIQGRHAEATTLLLRTLAIWEKALGVEHPNVGTALGNLALLYSSQGRVAEAETISKRGVAIRENALGPEHPSVAVALNNLAWLAFDAQDWARAADYWQRSTAIIKRRAERDLAEDRATGAGGEAPRLAWQFSGLVKMRHRLAAAIASATAIAETFETAQWALSSEAAASLAQMATRSAKGSPQLGVVVREQQDLVREWRVKDKLLIAAKSEPPPKRKAAAEKVLADRLAIIDTRLAEIDRTLAQEFPDYAALASPSPASVAEVQAQLGADEALVLFLDTPEAKPLAEESFIWVVTRTEVRWVRSDFGTGALTREIMALRCGLDATAWDGAKADACAKALGIPLAKAPRPGQALPFDHARAHRLYTALFGGVQDLIKGKHLLIVPSGPLTQLPFQVLVARPPTSSDHRAAAWLARDHAITVLPAVASLKALRRVSRPSAAPRPMFGIGNPLLDGHTGLAKLARAKQRCPETLGPWKVTVVASPRGGVAQVETRGGLADLSHIKAQLPLPETADELCAVAQDVKADVVRDIRLGSLATEREIKRLSASGELAKYRMVHFATHGVLARQLDGTHEPGLILTPPEKATEDDDGYLTASEIATLKLDADWAILSACNTAAGASTSAEALSGLARAFIYAQTRALLVSHWEVYSDATVKLITTAIREMANDPKVGRAEAMRRSMLALIDKGAPEEAHPAYWAPFVVVGEGAARR